MTASVMLGLCLQGAAVWIVHVAIRGRWLRHIGALFLLVTVFEHGFTEVMQWIWPGRNPYRFSIGQSLVDNWMLLVSAVILVYAITFAAIVRLKKDDGALPENPENYVAGLKLRYLLLACAPLAVATFQGRGALQPVAPGETASRDGYVVSGLAGQYLIVLLGVVGVVLILRYGQRSVLPVLAGQVFVISAIGARAAIVITCVVTLIGASYCKVRPTRRQVVLAGVLVAVVGAGISASRAAEGRGAFMKDSGFDQRVTALTDGVTSVFDEGAADPILNDIVYRFDCNSYGAILLHALESSPPIGVATIQNNVMLSVPSFLNPDKLSTSLEARNEEAFIGRWFGLSQKTDWLPGMYGTILTYGGAVGLFLAAILLAISFALLGRLVRKDASAWRLALAMGLLQCILLYEVGPSAYFTQLRGAASIAAAMIILRLLRPVLPNLRKSLDKPIEIPALPKNFRR